MAKEIFAAICLMKPKIYFKEADVCLLERIFLSSV
jgi:hypothetical protein